MSLGLVDASYSLCKWQAVKLAFFATCNSLSLLHISFNWYHRNGPLSLKIVKFDVMH